MGRADYARVARAVTLMVLGCAGVPGLLSAQTKPTRWTIDPITSLAWFQTNPNFAHLWGTTCPRDPSWVPGEGHGANYPVDEARRKKTWSTRKLDNRIPLYPRNVITNTPCRQAVTGEVVVQDTAGWTGVRGTITFLPDSLVTGLDVRDAYMHRILLKTYTNREITFAVDSVIDVKPAPDTLRAVAVGTMTMLGKTQPIQGAVRAWKWGDALRVRVQWQLDPFDLTDVWGISKLGMGMGSAMGQWKEFHLGADLILRPVAGGTSDDD